MKKLISFICAIVLFGCTCLGAAMYCRKEIAAKKQELTYYNDDIRNSCRYAMDVVIDDHSIPFFGSSELSAITSSHPRELFHNGNSDFNMVLIGRGYMQSLHHAITLGAIADDIPGKKVVLNLSPQWFTASHLSPDAYASRFSERLYAAFLKNSNITYETKSKITNRVKDLLSADEKQKDRVEKYKEIYLKHSFNPVVYAEMGVYDAFMDLRQLIQMKDITESLEKNDLPQIESAELDWNQYLLEAEKEGEHACTNNDLFIYDEYYDLYIKDNIEAQKDANVQSSYLESPEYEDLRLFLEVCKETGIEPLVVNVPVNGRWYDWTGWPKEDREGYYQKIRDICAEYHVQIADFSDKEYEPYFLKDVMHMGWKGWVYVDEAVYKFYKGDL